ncbi:MAG TPA: sulfite exporter TauE/SafE family protein [Acetobacteraceae bacterium]|nr:sulfite exporter TauE/SafE family protein [Acetobacteraceae bacterium]
MIGAGVIGSGGALYVASGLLVGLLVGLTGVGGGSLMTPLLVMLFGVHPAAAVGTDLLYAAASKSVGTAVRGLGHAIAWRIAAWLALGSLPAAAVTLFILSRFDLRGPGVAQGISIVLGIALVLSAASLVLRQRIAAIAARRMPTSPPGTARLTVLTGAVLGVLVSVSSVGAGALGMTVLVVLYPREALNRLVGTDIAHAVPLTLLAGVGHWLLGDVRWHVFALLLAGAVPGICIGSLLGGRVSERVLRPLLAGVLALVGVRLVMGALA